MPTPKPPLKAHEAGASFKIYALDVGLLGALARLPSDTVQGDLSILSEYQGAFVENFVAQHLVAMLDDPQSVANLGCCPKGRKPLCDK